MAVSDRWHRAHPKNPNDPVCPEHGKYPTDRHGKGRRWWVRYRGDGGGQRNESFDKKTQAEARDLQIAAEAQQGIYRDPNAGKTTFRTYADDWLATRPVNERSRNLMRRRLAKHVYPKLGDIQLRRIRPTTISAWLAALPGSDNTKRDMFGYVKAILGAAVDDDILGRNPAAVRSVKPPKATATEARAWTREQVAAVREALPNRYRILADLMAGLGLRIGEAVALGKHDVDFLRGQVHVRRQIAMDDTTSVFSLPKGRTSRTVPLRPALRDRLSAYLAEHPARPITLPWSGPQGADDDVTVDLIVTSPQARHVYANTFYDGSWWPAVKAAGMDRDRANGPHGLRHTYTSVLLANGVPITEVQQYLGHTTPIVTWRVYAHFVPPVEVGESGERVIRGLAALDDLLAPAGDDATATGTGEQQT